MMEILEWLKTWFFSLGERYHVNPWIFGSIYVGAIPFFFASLGWLIRRLKQKESIVLPVMSIGFFFLSAYLYLIIVGENIPSWVYFLIVGLVLYGVYSTWMKIKKGLNGS